MSQFGPEEAVARIAEWRGKKVRWEVLGGGITNHNYVVWVDERASGAGKYVLRIPGAGTDLFIDRASERDCTIQAAAAGVAPPVTHVIDPEGGLVTAFVEGEIMHPHTMAGHPERIVQAVRTVRALHDDAVFAKQVRVFEMLARYTALARTIGARVPERLEALLGVLDRIERATSRDPLAPVACHNDLLSENFIVDAAGRMWIVDWEYGGMTDPCFELGDFVMEHPFTREEEELVVATYCGGGSDRFFARTMLYKLVSAVWWALWAQIQRSQSRIDFDYKAWGTERIARAERCLGDPDFERWLRVC